MTHRSENNLTEIMARTAERLYTARRDTVIQAAGEDAIHAEAQIPAWEDMEVFQQSKIKGDYLPLMMAVLDTADEVDAEAGRPTAEQFAVIAELMEEAIDEDLGLTDSVSETHGAIVKAIRAINPTLITNLPEEG